MINLVRDSQGFYSLPTDLLALISILVKDLSSEQMESLSILLSKESARNLTIEQLGFLSEQQASIILTAIELGRICWKRPSGIMDIIDCPQAAYNALIPELRGKTSEHFAALFLDVKNRLLEKSVVSVGNWKEAIVPIPEILRIALLKRACRIIVCHNHPSGSPFPSQEDRDITEQLGKACKLIDINLMDHIVFTDSCGFASIRQENQLPFGVWG